MPRFVGRNTTTTNYGVKSSANNAKHYGIGPSTTFDITVPDIEASDIRTQLGTLSGVTFVELDAMVQPRLIDLGTPVAPSTTGVHAAVEEGAANAFPGPITSPAVPRNITATFAAGWQGGDITIVGTDQNGQAQTEVIPDTADATVQGVKIFKTVTSISKEAVAGTTDSVTIGWGDKLGLGANVDLASGQGVAVFIDGVASAGTWDATNDAVLPGTATNGSRKFWALVNI